MSTEYTPTPEAQDSPESNLHHILERAGRSASKYLPVRVIPALTSLLTVPIFTHAIGPAEYGDFYLVISALAFLAHLSITWIQHSAVRFYWVHESENDMDRYTTSTLWSALGALIGLSLAAGVITWLLKDVISPGILELIPIAIGSFFANRLALALLEVLKAGNHAGRFARLSLTSTLVGTATSIFLVAAMDLGAWGIIAGNFVGFAVTIPASLLAVRRIGSISPRAFDSSVVRTYAHYGLPLAAAGISYWLLVLSDRYIIAFARGSAEAGLYSVAYGLGEKLMQMIVLPLTMTMVPLLVEAYEKNGQAIAERVQTSFTRYFALIGFPLLLGLFATSEDFLTVFTAPEYRDAATVLPLISTAALLYGLTEIAGVGIALHKRTRITMTNTAVVAACNIGLNLILVPKWGYMAAAYTTVASYILLIMLTWIRSRPFMKWTLPWNDLLRIFAASSIMFILVGMVASNTEAGFVALLLEFVVGVTSYVLAAHLLRAIRPQEVGFLFDLGKTLWGSLASRSSR